MVQKQRVVVVINAAHKVTEKGYFKKQATAIAVRTLVNLPLAIIVIISLKRPQSHLVLYMENKNKRSLLTALRSKLLSTDLGELCLLACSQN